jgi:hypothetical protein
MDARIAAAKAAHAEASAVLDRLEDEAIGDRVERARLRDAVGRYAAQISLRFKGVAAIGGSVESASLKLQAKEITYEEYVKAVVAAGEAAEAAASEGGVDATWRKIIEAGPEVREAVSRKRAAKAEAEKQSKHVDELYRTLSGLRHERSEAVHLAIGEQSSRQLRSSPSGLATPLRIERADRTRRALDEAVARYRASLDHDLDDLGRERGGRRAIAVALEFYGRVANLSTPQAERVAGASINTNLFPGQRAFAKDDGSQTAVSLSATGNVSTAIHELGHAMEHGSAPVLWLAEAFQAYRCAGHETRRMNEFASRSGDSASQFEPGEFGNSDNFLAAVVAVRGTTPVTRSSETTAAYIGKVYRNVTSVGPAAAGLARSTKLVVTATEIVSTGMELLYEDPVSFARADPEFFDLMVAVATGAI